MTTSHSRQPSFPPRTSGHKADLKTFHFDTDRYRGCWDGLRRDPELWIEDADCSVFLYAEGHSRRGPSFQISSEDLINTQSTSLLACARPQPDFVAGEGGIPVLQDTSSNKVELYLAAPPSTKGDDAFRWHITTRNFFAWVRGKPLVGEHLGVALADLYERMRMWRPESPDLAEDVLVYADMMGYTVVEESPDHALAMLYFGEVSRLRNVWIDAFVHCVGMNTSLGSSTEFDPLSKTTKALITRAYLEMDLYLDCAGNALGTFLEEELSAAHLGLGTAARQHLDNFRGFLISYHVAKYGYWPPPKQSKFPKAFYQDLYNEFSHLYNYLADKSPHNPWRSVSGGICVQQNVDAFNDRQKYEPLPYSLPLLPRNANTLASTSPHKSFLALRKGAKNNNSAKEQLRAATNRDESLPDSHLVQHYILFEDEQADRLGEKVSPSDTRKVRWLLVYGVLQTLISTITAPIEVRNTQASGYPLCVSVAGLPAWDKAPSMISQSSVPSSHPTSKSSLDVPMANDNEATTPKLSIHPDCEADDYFKPLPTHNEETQTSTSGVALRKRSLSRGSFLRKASVRRRSIPPPAEPVAPPQLVSGRTLAELAYGEESPKPVQEGGAVSRAFEFRFPFGPSAEETKSIASEPCHLSIVMEDPEMDPSAPTFDESQLLLPFDVAGTSPQDASPTSCIPGLMSSHGSQSSSSGHNTPPDDAHPQISLICAKGTPAAHSPVLLAPDIPRKRGRPLNAQSIDGNTFLEGGKIPDSVTRGYDDFDEARIERESSRSPFDRMMRISMNTCIDEACIDNDMVDMYRSMCD